jgi:hypothetical protein
MATQATAIATAVVLVLASAAAAQVSAHQRSPKAAAALLARFRATVASEGAIPVLGVVAAE